ncbi:MULTISPECIES: MFS transporter [Streptomyces]|uniref:MFS transporter n=1 Tax=Streptomyces ardesiacus TaxID=285564 RepID=A0ABW8HD81_9ACTN|nr:MULTISPECIES: MFS transporter [Streptomyces]MCL7365527.1 MFS transporter [Streptomyces ardesiacus]NEB60121.1 MFS transporter [Streptomyces diastaticus]
MSRLHDPFLRGQLAIAALFLSLGFQYATWAARIPAIKTDLDLSAAEVGVLLMAAGVGAAVSFPAVAWLMRRMGSRRLALLSQLGLALLLLALAAAPDYPVALLVMCADGVLVGCLNVAMNAQGAALEARHERNTMARLHAVFSAGSLLAALLASGMTAATGSVAAHFAAAAVLLVALGATARTGLLDEDAPAGAQAPAEPKPDRRRWTLPSRLTLWMCCAMVFGTVAEGAMNDWSALYLKDIARASAELAPLGIAVVSGMMVVARLFADGWRSRWGDGRVVLLGSAVAGTGLALALVSGGVAPALAGFACMGLGIAAVTPCVYAAAARQGSDALTLVAAMGTTGLLAGPPLIGFIAGASDLAWGMGAVAASAGAVALCSTRIRWTAPDPVAQGGATPA